MAIWNILQTFGIFYDHLVHLCSFGTGFGIMYQEKSGNSGHHFRLFSTATKNEDCV
jgi:hypothetical protein